MSSSTRKGSRGRSIDRAAACRPADTAKNSSRPAASRPPMRPVSFLVEVGGQFKLYCSYFIAKTGRARHAPAPTVHPQTGKTMTCDLCADDGGRPWCVKACRDCGALTLVEAREALSRETRERIRGRGDRLGRHRHRGRGSLEEAGLFRDRDRAARLGAAGPLRPGDRPAPRRTHGGVRDAGVDRGEGAAYRRPGARRRRRDRTSAGSSATPW